MFLQQFLIRKHNNMLNKRYFFQKTIKHGFRLKPNDVKINHQNKLYHGKLHSNLKTAANIEDKFNLHGVLNRKIAVQSSAFYNNVIESEGIRNSTLELRKNDVCFGVNWLGNQSSSSLVSSSRIFQQLRQYSTRISTPVQTGKFNVVLPPSPKEETYQNDEETDVIYQKYTSPKINLNNIYQRVDSQLGQKHKLVTDFTPLTGGRFKCTYRVKWPEEMSFSAVARTKKEASHKAALAALRYLIKNNKISPTEKPLLFDKDQVQDLKHSKLPQLKLNEFTLQKMQEIDCLYKNELLANMVEDVEDRKLEAVGEDVSEVEVGMLPDLNDQKFLGTRNYLVTEKSKLPISDYKDNFINLLKTNNVVIIKGETGCGKSTRIPQYILEGWATEESSSKGGCRIVSTQPRRIAASSLAERVASERDEPLGNSVGYQVRFEGKFCPHRGQILFCTTGILLRHLQSDPKLSKFSHVILDEAHERDVNTDLLMNLLRTALELNPELKLVVMSATIDTNMFSEYYSGAPILEVPGFTYPVTQYYLDDFLEMDFSKTWQMCDRNFPYVVPEDIVRMVDYIHGSAEDDGAILVFLPGWTDMNKISQMLEQINGLTVHCLHSRINSKEQRQAFSRAPPGRRKVILATNIAETSVTIEDVVYVVDTGIHKQSNWDVEKGIQCIDNTWIAKSNVTQRKGRAGRVKPGKSYHLYTKAKYDTFIEHNTPELLRTSLTKIVLDCKVFSNNMRALDFMSKLPSPPSARATQRAVKELIELELLNSREHLTDLGRVVANFQLEPKLVKAMINSVVFKCVTPVVDIATIYAADEPLFMSSLRDKASLRQVKKSYCDDSDHLAMMRLFEDWLRVSEEKDFAKLRHFSSSNMLVLQRMSNLERLRTLHFEQLYEFVSGPMPIADDFSDNSELVKAILYSGVGKLLIHNTWEITRTGIKRGGVLHTRHNRKATIAQDSVNAKKDTFSSPYLLNINETRSDIRNETMVRECSEISSLAVLLFSHKNLIINNIEGDEDKVLLSLEGTNVKLLCDKLHAEELISCKKSIDAAYDYFIFQLTKGKEKNEYFNKVWDTILKCVSDILDHNVPKS